MISNADISAQAPCSPRHDPSELVSIKALLEEVSKTKEDFKDSKAVAGKKYTEALKKLAILISAKKKSVAKLREQLELDETALKNLDQQIQEQLVALVGAQKAAELIIDGWNQKTTNAEQEKIVGEFMTPKGTYRGLMALLAAKKGINPKDFEKIKDVSMEFFPAKAGEFMMGSPFWEKERTEGEDLRTVQMKEPFEIGKTEVTQLQYYLIMGTNPANGVDAREPDYMVIDGTPLNANRPIENVSWDEVQVFIQKLNEQDDKYNYRLPTEAEWEFTARAGTTTVYSFGDKENLLEKYAVSYENSKDHVAQVASKEPNPWGLYDVHGNVFEWCSDICRSSYYPNIDSLRVIRSGSYRWFVRNPRSAFRHHGWAFTGMPDIGFRLVRTPKNQNGEKEPR